MSTVITDVDRSPWYDRLEAPRDRYAATRCAALPAKKGERSTSRGERSTYEGERSTSERERGNVRP
jgi:hypothetical protein